jgi:hypothetical protein
MEIALLGDYIDYKGSALIYFVDLDNKNKEVSQRIHSAFKQIKNNK